MSPPPVLGAWLERTSCRVSPVGWLLVTPPPPLVPLVGEWLFGALLCVALGEWRLLGAPSIIILLGEWQSTALA